MTDKPISPLRQRMIEDMTARHFAEKVQKDYIRHNGLMVLSISWRYSFSTRDGGLHVSPDTKRCRTPFPRTSGNAAQSYQRFHRP